MGISAIVITYNEEPNIERCFASLGFADELIVVDSFSTDRTVEIARRYTQNIHQREFTGFSEQRAAGLALATQDWIFVVDIDEVVTPELAEELLQAAGSGLFDSYRMPRLTQFLGRDMRHCGWYPDYQRRLCRRSRVSFPPRLVHESIEVDGEVGVLRNDLLHYSYQTMEDYTRKMVLYARAAARQKMIDGREFRITDMLFNPPLTFAKMYFAKQGYRDGVHGFVLSVLTACSSALRYAMLWEMTVRGGSSKE